MKPIYVPEVSKDSIKSPLDASKLPDLDALNMQQVIHSQNETLTKQDELISLLSQQVKQSEKDSRESRIYAIISIAIAAASLAAAVIALVR